jgi:hypothetical protein
MRNYVRIPRWIVALVLYLLIVLLLFAIKPALMFSQDGRMKDFGIGLSNGKSVFAPAVLLPILAVFCFFISTIIYVVI